MPNRLAHETSPYLLQHQHNPVDWYPWGPEALALAKELDRPILLSVGYSACHWCHVMERESFEDADTAAVMNEGFVNIKVDREERPDLDEIYMRAVQAFSGGHGGWPMTLFLTPDGAPFLAGTYFPPTARQGMPSFRQIMAHALTVYREQKGRLDEVTREVKRYLEASGRLPAAAGEVGGDWLARIAEAARQEFDAERGGFGAAPKFPPHGTLAVLLAHHHRSGEARSLEMATRTLDAMAKGGMYDQLSGGFARYSVDKDWRIPHFEKMLYDNGQLLGLYVDAWLLTGKPSYERVVRQTVGFLLDELRDPQGGFWSALDADSEGEEGRFYAWTPEQVRLALAGSEAGPRWLEVCELLQVSAEGSFEHGSSVLRLERPLDDLSASQRELVERALPILHRARAARVRPGTDDKVLTAWNALAIGRLARASSAFDEEGWFEAAATAAIFLLEELTVDGRLLRTWKGGRAHTPAYADDYAFFIQALVDLYQAGLDEAWLVDALRLADQMLDLFWDAEQGGLFYTGRDAEPLITRSKHMLGGAEPSANGVAALALARLALLCDRPDLREKAEQIARCYRPLLEQAPRVLGAEALAAAWLVGPTLELGVVGPSDAPFDSEDTLALVEVFRRRYLPFGLLAVLPPDADEQLLALLPWMKGRQGPRPRATAWLCQGSSCQLPTTDAAALGRQLDELLRPDPQLASGRVAAPPLPEDPALWLNASRPVTAAELTGQAVLLHFWTAGCVACAHQAAELASLQARLADRPLVVLGVHGARFPASRSPEAVQRAIAARGMGHPVLLDPDLELALALGVRAWPTLVLLDGQGRIAWRHEGEVRAEQVEAAIRPVLDELHGKPLASLSAAPAAVEGLLRLPGKVHLFPDAAAQVMGEDPFGPEARLYIADTGHHRILEASLSLGADGWPQAQIVRTFGSGVEGLLDSRASLARFRSPQGLARSGSRLWVADAGNHALRAIDLDSGAVRTMAGTGRPAQPGPVNRQPPRETDLRSPWEIAIAGSESGMPGAGGDGELVFIAMAGAHQIWVYLEEQDQVGPFLGSGVEDHIDGEPQEAALAQPGSLLVFGRYLFFVDAETGSVRVFDFAERQLGTVIGRGLDDFGDVDGGPEEARLQHPTGLTLADGDLFVADTFNHKIKRVSLQGGETGTLAGGEGLLCEPGGLTAAGEFLIVADTHHHELKVVRIASGELRTLRISSVDEA